MSAMLRSQGIPTKLEVGYSGEAYHAWISTYIKESGWVDNIIKFEILINTGSAIACYVI